MCDCEETDRMLYGAGRQSEDQSKSSVNPSLCQVFGLNGIPCDCLEDGASCSPVPQTANIFSPQPSNFPPEYICSILEWIPSANAVSKENLTLVGFIPTRDSDQVCTGLCYIEVPQENGSTMICIKRLQRDGDKVIVSDFVIR
jgi:hypothetical protein